MSVYDAGSPHYLTSTITYVHATAKRYHPAPEGGSYEEYFVCTHNHPDTREGVAAVRECGQRLVRILRTGRVPAWAVKS
jgi:acid phosphatase class B